MSNYAHQVSVGPLLFPGAGLLFLSLTMLTVGVLVYQRTLTQPITALRSE